MCGRRGRPPTAIRSKCRAPGFACRHFTDPSTERRVQSAPFIMTELTIESLDQEGRGIAHAEGKVVFVEGALPGERVTAEVIKRKPSYEIARVVTVHTASAARVSPRCPHFGVCG